MRIGFSLLDLAMGGAQTFLVQLAKEMSLRGHDVSYCLHSHRIDPSHVAPSLLAELDAVAVSVSQPKKLLKNEVIQLDGYHNLRRKIPYLTHLNRCVETYHSVYSIRRSGPIYARYRVSISKAVQVALHHPSQVIYPGSVLPEMDHFALGKEFDVAILGRIHPVKGHLLFLQVCERLYQQRGQLRALMIGGHPKSGPYQENVDAQVQRLRRMGIQIHTTGDIPADEVFTWLERSRLLLVTSESEGLGRMAMEALACYVPVISNPVGGLREIVIDGQTGLLAERDNPVSFAQLTNHLLGDESLRQCLGKQGRKYAQENFSLQAVANQYENLYQKVAQESRR
ncbi:MAG TPA: hypothetical protein DEH25_17470 [Chloroflexi bacterium]|nr:hypothetical protein [Chloroflexota bacterium]